MTKLTIMSRKRLVIALFLLPSLIALTIFTYYSIFDAFRLSFYSQRGRNPPVFIGVDNYLFFLRSPIFREILWNTVILTLCTIVPSMVLALLSAILIQEVRWRMGYRLALFLPYVIPYAAVAMIWVVILDPSIGPLQQLLRIFGVAPIGWFGDSRYSLWAIIMMSVWRNYGYYALIYAAGLQLIPQSLYDSARIDGASWLRLHRHVTLPMLGPYHLFVLIVSILQSFQAFTLISMTTYGGPGYSSTVLIYHVWEQAFRFWQLGRAGALTAILLVIQLVLTLVIFGLLGRRITYEVS